MQRAEDRNDCNIEADYLWQYTAVTASTPVILMELNSKIPKSSVGNFILDGEANGIALWVEWCLDEEIVVSTGPIADRPAVGSQVEWDIHTKQGVYFTPDTWAAGSTVYFKANWKRNDDFNLSFKLEE